MPSGRLSARLARKPGWRDYLLALGLAGAAVLACALLGLRPRVADFNVLLPAVVVAGVFCGTAPAALAAAAGAAALGWLFLGPALLAWPPGPIQIDALLFAPGCLAVLWATHAVRRGAAEAAAAEARLAEVFRQIPGAAAILEAPGGALLLRSTQSDAVLGQGERRMDHSGELAGYGGVHADGRPYAAGDYPIARALEKGEVVSGEALRYRRPDGRLVDLEVHAGPVRGPQGRVMAAVGMAFDVTARREAERRLAESEARHRALAGRLRAAVDAGELGVWEYDLATRRITLDARLAGMLGLPGEAVEMAGAEMRAFADPADLSRAGAMFTGALARGGAYADEVRMRTAQGEPRWFVSRGAVLTDIGRIVGVVSDVTERREREDALHAALHARDVLAHEADHRIKNSLQLVVSLLRLQRSRVPDPDARRAITEAMARVDAIATAHLALQRSPDLRGIEIDRMLADLCRSVGALNPSVALRCEARVGLWLDAEQAIPLGLIASELLTNALRHAWPAGEAGEASLTAARDADGALVMTIADDGAGLPAAPGPPGLGSLLVATLARQIGAIVTTESAAGRGVRATVRLAPADAGEAEETTRAGAAAG